MSPRSTYLAQKHDIDAAIRRVMDSGVYVMGTEVAAFERVFAAWLGAPFAVSCANGTDAITLAIRACGVRRGARVATVSHTAVATVAAIELAGARPVLLDVGDDYTMDLDELASLLAEPVAAADRIEAVVIVHLYGQPADMARLTTLCEHHHVVLIEDCSQAHGAKVRGRMVGTFGMASTFSFYPTKNLGAFGDGGAVAVQSPEVAEKLKTLRQYGWNRERSSLEPGCNSRLDELQAAILSVKLKSLDAGNARRRQIAALYHDALKSTPLTLPPAIPGTEPVFHQYVVRSRQRDDLRGALAERGIETGIHYAEPVHVQPAYRNRVMLGPARCQHTERLCDEILSLPMAVEMIDADLQFVTRNLVELSQ